MKTATTGPDRSGDRFDAKRSRRIASASSAASDMYANPDGSYTRKIYQERVNFRAADGSWQPIDTSLVKAADGRLAAKANSIGTDFAGRADDARLASLRVAGASVGYSLRGAAAVSGAVSGSDVTYSGVLADTDLVLSSQPGGVKEQLVLRSADSPTQWVFPLRLEGLTPRLAGTGVVELVDAAGSVAAVIPPGYMHDSKFDPRSGSFAESNAVRYELTSLDGAPALRVSVDAGWVRDAARVFPITVDPSLSTQEWPNNSTYVQTGKVGDHEYENELPIGTYNGGTTKARSFIKFDAFGEEYAGAKITSTVLNIFALWTFSCRPASFGVYPVTQSWVPAYTTTYPGPAIGGTALGTAVNPAPGAACTNDPINYGVGQWMQVNLDASVMTQWALSGVNNGLALVASETSNDAWKKFCSARCGHAPYLAVTYTPNEVPQVNGQYPGFGYAANTLTPELLVAAADVDSWPNPALSFNFQVYDSGGNKVAESGATTVDSWVVPAGVLKWGQSYTWTVVAFDGSAASTSQTVNLLTTSVPQPAVTSGLSQNGGRGFEASVGNYTTSATDASVATVGPPLAIQRAYNSLDPRTGSAFGAGWSSVADMAAAETTSGSGANDLVVVRYPSGQEIAFGRNPDGTFAPPQGRFATLAAVSGGGYQLVDKDGTTYRFTASAGSGRWAVASVADASGRTETFTYNASGQLTKITSASGRALYLTWSAASGGHVSTVVTDPVTPGVASSALTWTYSYSGDALSAVCPPTSATACTSYTYGTNSLYRASVDNLGPRSHWALGEASGTVAASAVLVNEGTDNGTYTDVSLGTPGAHPGSSATVGGFNGTSSRVELPATLPNALSYQSVGLWFKTTSGGVLLGQSADPIGQNTTGGYAPVLYVGTDGKLYGAFATGPAVGPLGTVQGKGSGRCLEVTGAATANNTLVKIYDCTGAEAQRWTLTAAGELRVTIGGVTKCLDAAGTTDGSDLRIWDCNGASNQQWRLSADGRIIGAGSGRCVDAWLGDTANGTPGALNQCAAGTAVADNQAWFTSAHAPIASTSTVADGAWHHVVLSAAGTTQTLYLDGQIAGSKSGEVQDIGQRHQYVGAGFLGGGWPAQSHPGAGNTGYGSFFAGSIGELSAFDRPLTAPLVASLYRAGSSASHPLTSVLRPSGNASASVSYDGATGVVTQVVDSNGGTWKINPAVVSGSSQVYVGSVLSGRPMDYWRLAETGTAEAINQVHGNTARYNAVSLGTAGGPFEDATVAGFNGTSSYVSLPAADVPPANGPFSVSLWFKTPAGNTSGGVLYGYQSMPISADMSGDGDWVPALYVGTDGYLHSQIWINDANRIMASDGPVNDGNWHHVVLAAGVGTQSLYVDGVHVDGPVTAPMLGTRATHANIGAGKWSTWPATSGPAGLFTGSIAEVAIYGSQLSQAQAVAQYAARAKSTGSPARTITVTDPGNKATSYSYDAVAGRKVAEVDALGNKTQYGYDTGGFLRTVTDPNGNVTTTEHDVRGNTVSSTTCQNQAANKCSTVYFTYFPDATSRVLSPDPRNDVMLTMRDGRSASATDTTYLTSYGYDAKGNRTSVTDPLGRVTLTAYTDGTSVAAADGGLAPPGLPMSLTTAGGAKQAVTYFRNGDVARVVDPAGKVTTFSYDGLGRALSKTDTTDTFPGGLTTALTYDGLNRTVSETAPAVTNRVTGAVHTARTSTVYDDDGLAVSQTVTDTTGGDAPRTIASTYDAHGLAAETTDPAGKTTRFAYDAYGNVATETSSDGTRIDSSFDAEGNLLTSTLVGFTGDPNNPSAAQNLVVTSKAYDPAGRLASVTDAMGWVSAYTYTDNGLTATVTRRNPASGETFVQEADSYDAAGHLIAKTTNNGATTTSYTIDAAGRTTASTLDPGGLARTTSYTYSPDDYVLSTTQAGATGGIVAKAEAAYDPLGRMTSRTAYSDGVGRPAGWWKLNETSGTTAADATGAGQTGALSASGVSWSAEGAATFNGTSGAITTAGAVVNTAQSFSVSAWVKLAGTAGWPIAVGQDGNRVSGFYLEYDTSAGKWGAGMPSADADNPALIHLDSTSTPVLGQWTHLTLVRDMAIGQMRLYVNGTQEASVAYTGAGYGTGGLSIGRGKYNGALTEFFNGSVANVQAYNRAITNTEVGTLYGNGRTGTALSINRLTTTWSLDKGGLATSMSDPLGNTTSYSYDEAGRAVLTVEPTVASEVAGSPAMPTHPVTSVGYNTFGEPTEASDANGNVVTTGYDAAGRVTTRTLPDYTPPGASTPITAVERRGYDSLGQLVSASDPLGNTTSYAYDQLGRTSKVTDPNGGETRFTYDLLGDQLSVSDPIGAVSAATYDYLGRKLTTSQAVRQTSAVYTTSYSYGAGGWLSQVRSPTGVTSASTYNAAGETLTVTDGAGNLTRHEYDAAGRRTRTVLPDGSASSTGYDLLGQPLLTTTYDPAGKALASQSSGYDGNGNVVASTDARGTTTRFTYDAGDRLSTEVQPISASDAITTSFGYDAAGNRTRFTDGRGNAFWNTYNRWSLPESQIEPSTQAHPDAADRTFTLAYDAAGRLAQTRLPGGVNVTNSYDSMGRLTRSVGTGAEVATADRVIGYDGAGRLTSASGPGGTNTFSYDDRDLLTSTSGPSGASSFTYTPDAAMATRVDAAGTTSYGYDTAGRLASVTNPGTGVAMSLAYNSLNQVTTMTYGSGGAGGDIRALSYDGMHRLAGDEFKTPAGTTIAKITYGWDGNGNLTAKTTSGFAGAAANTYTYDLADRLTSWDNGTTATVYAYDKSGNRVQAGAKAFTYDARNRLLTGPGTSYRYTPRGTLAAAVTAAGTLTTTCDAFGEVTSQDATPGQAVTYTYDALGRVIKPGFAYTGLGNTLAADGTATYTRGTDGQLLGVAAGSAKTLAWTDQHTDVVGQFTPTGTALAGSRAYDPLGVVLANTGMIGNLGYQSAWTETATGRVNMLARWYNTDTGQFDTRDAATLDPVPDSVGANRYAYADDNPLTNVDPSGTWSLKGLVKSAISAGKSIVNTATSVVRSVYANVIAPVMNFVANVATTVFNAAVSAVRTATTWAKNTAAGKWLANKAAQARKWVAQKAAAAKARVQAALNYAKQKAQEQLAKAKRMVAEAKQKLVDAYHATASWVAEHKSMLIEIAAIGAGVLAGLACSAITLGAGAVACMIGAAALVNLAKDAAQGNIHNWGDAFGSLGTGALQGALGVGGGMVGGKIASFALGKMGNVAGNMVGRMLSGGVTGGVADAFTQMVTTGHVDWGGVGISAAIGALTGARAGKTGGKGGGARAEEPTPGRRSADESAPPPARSRGADDSPQRASERSPAGRDEAEADGSDALQDFATSQREVPGTKFASEYTSTSGRRYYSTNRHGTAGALEEMPELQGAVTAAGHHGGCAEVGCLIQAYQAEGPSGITGGTIRTVNVRNPMSSRAAEQGKPAYPCGRCQRLLGLLDVDWS